MQWPSVPLRMAAVVLSCDSGGIGGRARMQLLESTMGGQLPAEVRQALLGLGTSCNDAQTLLGLAAGADNFVQRRIESARALGQVAKADDDMALVACSWRNQAVAAYARAAVRYAAYASQVAAAVAAGKTPEMPDTERLVPSALATDFDRLLPVVRFPSVESQAAIAEECNGSLLEMRQRLENFLLRRLSVAEIAGYDDLQADGTADMTEELPKLLHRYGTEIVFALAHFSRADDPDQT
jgi:hypothetical protein